MTSRVIDLAARAEALVARRRVQILLLSLLIGYGAYRVRGGMGDFAVYRRAAARTIAGESPYRLEDRHRYLYAPIVTVVLLPLAVLPATAGRAIWCAANLCMVVAILRWTARLVYRDDRAPLGFLALVLALAVKFIDNDIGHGQLNILLLWLVLAAYRAAGHGRISLAGLALAAAIAAKLLPGILLVQLLIRRQWRFLLATVAALALLMIVPLSWWGPQYPALVGDWMNVLADQVGHYDVANKINQSISAFAYRLFRPYAGGRPFIELSSTAVLAVTVMIHFAFLAPLLRLSARLRRIGGIPPEGPRGDELALYLLYSTVLSPYSWKYYFVNLMLPFGAALRHAWEEQSGPARRGLWLVFLLNLLPARDVVGKRWSTILQLASFHFLGAAVLFALIARDAARELRAAPGRDGPP